MHRHDGGEAADLVFVQEPVYARHVVRNGQPGQDGEGGWPRNETVHQDLRIPIVEKERGDAEPAHGDAVPRAAFRRRNRNRNGLEA
jgi:hypothetical protein